jgi:hypothetical protein
MFKLEDGVPLPAHTRRGHGRPAKYPFLEMGVGQSFLAPKEDAERVGAAAKIWKRRHAGWDYVTRTDESGIRVWRTA